MLANGNLRDDITPSNVVLANAAPVVLSSAARWASIRGSGRGFCGTPATFPPTAPDAGISRTALTIAVVCGPPIDANLRGLVDWKIDAGNRYALYSQSGTYKFGVKSGNVWKTASVNIPAGSVHSVIGVFVNGAPVQVYVDGVAGTPAAGGVTPVGTPAALWLGYSDLATYYLGSPVSSWSFYNYGLTDAQAADLHTSIIGGLGSSAAPLMAGGVL